MCISLSRLEIYSKNVDNLGEKIPLKKNLLGWVSNSHAKFQNKGKLALISWYASEKYHMYE